MIHFGVISLLPEMFACLEQGVVGRAFKQGLAKLDCWNPRQWASGSYQQVDDKPYGGGPGMVMMYAPLRSAIKHAKSKLPNGCKTVYLSPQGKRINQQDLTTIAARQQSILFIAGRYEGIDERIIEHHVDEEWSLADFVLSGGEIAAMAFIDAVVRLLPGTLGHVASAQKDSFMNGLLDCPHYTRPAMIEGYEVPAVLLSGNDGEIERWQRKQILGKTWLKRPDLLENVQLTDKDRQLLTEFKNEHGCSS